MLTHQAQAAADQVAAVIPFGILGGMLGGAITGLVLQTFGLGPRQTG
jgi:predicted lipid-binding transport protein (Tim44 family)